MTIDRRSTILVAIGGVIGAAVRWSVIEVTDSTSRFPWPTLLVNVAGAFGLGLLVRRNVTTRFFLGTGVCGGLTTFSTLSLELASRLEAGDAALALGYAAASIILGISAFTWGRWLA